MFSLEMAVILDFDHPAECSYANGEQVIKPVAKISYCVVRWWYTEGHGRASLVAIFHS